MGGIMLIAITSDDVRTPYSIASYIHEVDKIFVVFPLTDVKSKGILALANSYKDKIEFVKDHRDIKENEYEWVMDISPGQIFYCGIMGIKNKLDIIGTHKTNGCVFVREWDINMNSRMVPAIRRKPEPPNQEAVSLPNVDYVAIPHRIDADFYEQCVAKGIVVPSHLMFYGKGGIDEEIEKIGEYIRVTDPKAKG